MKKCTPLETALSLWLAAAMKRHGAKQLWLSAATGICPSIVNYLIRGRRAFTVSYLERIAAAFEIQPSALLAQAEALIPASTAP